MKSVGNTIVILGANGFVGSRLCEKLYLARDNEVIGLVRNLGRASRIGRLGMKIYRGNVLDQRILDELIGRADVVVNLIAGDARSIVKGTEYSALLARKHGVARYIHMSSAAVYGVKPLKEHIVEDVPLRKTGNAYADAKIAAERCVQREIGRGLNAVMLRPRIIWGPYSPWVLAFYEGIVDHRFYLVDEGHGACNTVYIDNLIDTITWAMESGEATGETFFVTDDEHVTWYEFYSRWASYLRDRIEFINVASDEIVCRSSRELGNVPIRRPFFNSELKNLALNFPGIGAISRRIHRNLMDLPESRKLAIKSRLGISWPEKKLAHANKSRPQIDPSRALRESGDGFTCVDKIRNRGFRPRIDFVTGSEITRAWLEFARYV